MAVDRHDRSEWVRSSWRRWATPITLLLLLGFLGYGLWWGWQELTKPPTTPSIPPCVVQSASSLNTSQVRVKVFNGGTAAGAAGQITEQLKVKGFATLPPANTAEAVPTTIIVGNGPEAPEVLLVQGFFPASEVRADGRTDGTVDVLIGDNFPGFNDQAPTEVAVPGGTVCVPGGTPAPETSAPA